MVKENVERVRARIAAAALRANRDPKTIRLIAITKGVSVQRMEEAIAAGISDVGENRVQEAREKKAAVKTQVCWHLVGNLQRNKVRTALELFDAIDSVDRLELAEQLQRTADAMQRVVDVLVQVNVAGVETRFGAVSTQVSELVEKIRGMSKLNVKGLMTLAPVAENPELVRPIFHQLKQLAYQMELKELSMGMSQDFEVAIEEGATMVRIGTAIFGER